MSSNEWSVRITMTPVRFTLGLELIAINPRMTSQFADLFEKVDGTNTYTVLLDLAASKKPQTKKGMGLHRMATSCVLRTFKDRKVIKLPSMNELEQL